MSDTSTFKAAAPELNAASMAAKSEKVGLGDSIARMVMPAVPDLMTKIPALPDAHPATPQAHKFNSMESAKRFGTDSEKAKVMSDASSNYPGCDGGKCPAY